MKPTIDKQDLKDWIDQLDNKAYLVTLQSMKNRSTGEDFWDNLPEETKQNINQAKKEAKEGKGIPHEKVMKQVRDRFFK
ncbi:hypothetical protein [Fodinibius sp.]|uniref:hypothetical protein n=1 Tax=Fodinibius sp. TaxID=1872440 RepID=UPI002ACD7C61|nr:hypothetical protein [Fodinibius sp.]MDZ7657648.1 hypothetical protein [Fodinibius sp.]